MEHHPSHVRPPVNIIKKICLLGDPAVGKTSLIQRFVFDVFREDYMPTIGTKVVKKTMIMDLEPKRAQQVRLSLLIFDLLGQIEFAKVHRTYYIGSEGALIVGDLTRRDTLSDMAQWHERFRGVVGDVPVIYIGNKADLAERIPANKELLSSLAANNEMTYLYTSARSGDNVERAFELLAKSILAFHIV